jgi:hypothetical protein
MKTYRLIFYILILISVIGIFYFESAPETKEADKRILVFTISILQIIILFLFTKQASKKEDSFRKNKYLIYIAIISLGIEIILNWFLSPGRWIIWPGIIYLIPTTILSLIPKDKGMLPILILLSLSIGTANAQTSEKISKFKATPYVGTLNQTTLENGKWSEWNSLRLGLCTKTYLIDTTLFLNFDMMRETSQSGQIGFSKISIRFQKGNWLARLGRTPSVITAFRPFPVSFAGQFEPNAYKSIPGIGSSIAGGFKGEIFSLMASISEKGVL